MSNIWAITASVGIADGIADPCGISVLLFLIAYMLGLGSRRRVVAYGLTYSFIIGLIYFLFMVGLLKAMVLLPYAQAIRIGVGIILVVWGALELKDYFFPNNRFVTEMPKAVKKGVSKLIAEATLPAVLLLGVLVALGDIPCASGFTLFYTYYLIGNGIKGLTAIFFLVLYNFFMVLPLIIITLLLYFGLAKVNEIQSRGARIRQYLHLLTGVLFVVIALFMFF